MKVAVPANQIALIKLQKRDVDWSRAGICRNRRTVGDPQIEILLAISSTSHIAAHDQREIPGPQECGELIDSRRTSKLIPKDLRFNIGQRSRMARGPGARYYLNRIELPHRSAVAHLRECLVIPV